MSKINQSLNIVQKCAQLVNYKKKYWLTDCWIRIQQKHSQVYLKIEWNYEVTKFLY